MCRSRHTGCSLRKIFRDVMRAGIDPSLQGFGERILIDTRTLSWLSIVNNEIRRLYHGFDISYTLIRWIQEMQVPRSRVSTGSMDFRRSCEQMPNAECNQGKNKTKVEVYTAGVKNTLGYTSEMLLMDQLCSYVWATHMLAIKVPNYALRPAQIGKLDFLLVDIYTDADLIFLPLLRHTPT